MNFKFFFLVCLISCSLQAKPLHLEMKARSAILMNADTGAILFEKEAHQSNFPASITKVATALYVLERQKDLNKRVLVTAESQKMKPQKNETFPAYWLEADGTKMGLKVGETLSLDVLLHGLMIVSGNDAANVLAEATSGSIPRFLEELNEFLKSIGCLGTQFVNPHGLHHSQHRTTAYDMCLIAKKALQFPAFSAICSKDSYQKPATNKQPEMELKQHNHLVRKGSPFFYSKAIGVKNGYTNPAMHTLVAAAEQDGRKLLAVLFGYEKKNDLYADAKRLFETAFAEKKMKKVLFDGSETYLRSIQGAKSILRASLGNELTVEYYSAEEPDLKAYIHWEVPSLPIRKGVKVGELRLVDVNGKVWHAAPLMAREEVVKTFIASLKDQWNRLAG